MRKVITKSEGIRTAVRVIVLCLIISIWPLRLWHEDIAQNAGTVPAADTAVVAGDKNIAVQAFTAQYDHIYSIDLCLASGRPGEKFWLRLFDSKQQLISEQLVDTAECTIPGSCSVCINRDLIPGDAYCYLIQAAEGSSVTLALEDTAAPGNTSTGVLTYADSSVDNRNLLVTYRYREAMRKGRSLAVIFGLVAAGLLSDLLISRETKKRGLLTELVPDTWVWQIIGNPLIIALSAWGIIAVGPMHIFSRHIFDIMILEAGIVMLTITLLYAVNRKYKTAERSMALAHAGDHISDMLQTVFIALAVWATINYQNGTADVFHDIAFRQMLIFMGLAVISTYTARELWNIPNLIAAAVSAVTAGIVIHRYIPVQVDSYHVHSLRLTGVLAVVCALIAVNTFSIIKNRQFRPVSRGYAVFTAIYMALVIWRRNTRWWPVVMVVAFVVYLLRYGAWKRRSRLLINIAYGMTLNFVICTLYCLMHRPFLAFLLTRYPHMFFTVTETATYLAAALAAAMVLLFDRYNRTGEWRSCLGELMLFGVEMVYALFTMSRTVILAVAVTFMIMLFTLAGRGAEHRIRRQGTLLVSCILVTLWCFPICFSMQRIIPACVGQPYIFEYERSMVPDEIIRGNVPDSMYYMTFSRFCNYFSHKMFGTPDDWFDLNRYDIPSADIESDMSGALVASAGNKSIPDIARYMLPAIADSQLSESGQGTMEGGISNGRNSIFMSYISQMNLWGHDSMGATLEDGSVAAHAHNIYLQAAYDNGIIVGMVFAVWVLATLIMSFRYLKHRYTRDRAAGLPLAVTLTFASAGLVEWVNHPCIPLGLLFLLILPPLISEPADEEYDCDK